MARPQIRIIGARRGVAVIDQVGSCLDRAGAHIDAEHGGSADRPAEAHELVGAELVGFERLPGQFTAAWALILGANTVQPVVAAEEIAARVSNGGVALGTQRLQHIGAQAIGVCMGRLRLVDPFIDTSPHMFGEAAEQQRRDLGNGAIGIQRNFCTEW